MNKAISLDAAIIVTGVSKRTLWRRVTSGQITRQGSDARGRAMLTWADLIPLLCISVDPDDHQLFLDADAGNADAQNDLASIFLEADRPDVALHWLRMAVDQGHADAMHNLAMLHFEGVGVPKDETVGVMWLAKAASHGHPIGAEQMTALLSLPRQRAASSEQRAARLKHETGRGKKIRCREMKKNHFASMGKQFVGWVERSTHPTAASGPLHTRGKPL